MNGKQGKACEECRDLIRCSRGVAKPKTELTSDDMQLD